MFEQTISGGAIHRAITVELEHIQQAKEATVVSIRGGIGHISKARYPKLEGVLAFSCNPHPSKIIEVFIGRFAYIAIAVVGKQGLYMTGDALLFKYLNCSDRLNLASPRITLSYLLLLLTNSKMN